MDNIPTPTTFIYALADPATGEIRYVGKSVDPGKRLCAHLCEARHRTTNHRCAWLKQLLGRGLKPQQFIVASCAGDGCAEEQFHISLARHLGFRLVNESDGGEGQLGYSHTPETRAKLSAKSKLSNAKRRGVPRSPEVIAKIRAVLASRPSPHLGKPKSEETRRKLKAVWKRGNRFSDEVRAKMSASAKAKIARDPDAHREKTAKGWAKAIAAAQTPEAKAKRLESRKSYRYPPDVRAKIAASLRGRKQSPEQAGRHSETMKAIWAQRRAAKGDKQPALF